MQKKVLLSLYLGIFLCFFPFFICQGADLEGLAIESVVGRGLKGGDEPIFFGEKAFAFLEKQVSFGSRVPGSEAHEKCLYWMVEELHKYAADVTLQMFKKRPLGYDQEVRMTNVVARFSPNIKPRLLLGAHWDCRPWADKDPDKTKRGERVPGANDGASGVAVLLHIAQLLRQKSPPIGIDLVLFDGEDSGLYDRPESWCLGSQEFARRIKPESKPDRGIIIDMIGDKELIVKKEANSQSIAPVFYDSLWSAARSLGFDNFSQEKIGGIVDDHVFLSAGGIPTVLLIDLEYGGPDNHLWHTICDLPDRCSPKSLEVVGRVLMRVIYSGAGLL